MILITNDEVSGNALALAGRKFDLWAWSEALHVGPVGKTYDLSTFARDRALVFQYHGWDECQEVEADFKARNDALLRGLGDGEEVVLLFGAGIRDQLTLARLAAWLMNQASERLNCVKVSVSNKMIPNDSSDALWELIDHAEPAGESNLAEYESMWTAFVSDDPTDLEASFQTIKSVSLKAAVGRLLREYPSSENGLSLNGMPNSRRIFAGRNSSAGTVRELSGNRIGSFFELLGILGGFAADNFGKISVDRNCERRTFPMSAKRFGLEGVRGAGFGFNALWRTGFESRGALGPGRFSRALDWRRSVD